MRDRTEAEIAAIVKVLSERGVSQDDIEAVIGKVFAQVPKEQTI